MLNRHAIVLLLGNAALSLLRPFPSASYGLLAAGFLLIATGLLLDTGQPEPRSRIAHLLGLVGALTLLASVVRLAVGGDWPLHFAFAQLGIALAVGGLWLELEAGYSRLKVAVSIQSIGDLLYLGAWLLALVERSQTPSRAGWVFIGLVGSLSLYAATYNLLLQIRRLKNPQAGWRYRVVGRDARALRLQTPAGEVAIEWSDVEAIQRLDRRQLLVVLPSPLPEALAEKALPLEELRRDPDNGGPTNEPPDRYGLILHEQEIGLPLSEAEVGLRGCLSTSDRAN